MPTVSAATAPVQSAAAADAFIADLIAHSSLGWLVDDSRVPAEVDDRDEVDPADRAWWALITAWIPADEDVDTLEDAERELRNPGETRCRDEDNLPGRIG